GRKVQLQRIIERIKSQIPDGEPLILAGDFNDWREKASSVFFEELGLVEVFLKLQGKHALTFPSREPYLALDRIYVRGFECLSARCYTSPSFWELSDHGALYAELGRSTPWTEKK